MQMIWLRYIPPGRILMRFEGHGDNGYESCEVQAVLASHVLADWDAAAVYHDSRSEMSSWSRYRDLPEVQTLRQIIQQEPSRAMRRIRFRYGTWSELVRTKSRRLSASTQQRMGGSIWVTDDRVEMDIIEQWSAEWRAIPFV